MELLSVNNDRDHRRDGRRNVQSIFFSCLKRLIKRFNFLNVKKIDIFIKK